VLVVRVVVAVQHRVGRAHRERLRRRDLAQRHVDDAEALAQRALDLVDRRDSVERNSRDARDRPALLVGRTRQRRALDVASDQLHVAAQLDAIDRGRPAEVAAARPDAEEGRDIGDGVTAAAELEQARRELDRVERSAEVLALGFGQVRARANLDLALRELGRKWLERCDRIAGARQRRALHLDARQGAAIDPQHQPSGEHDDARHEQHALQEPRNGAMSEWSTHASLSARYALVRRVSRMPRASGGQTLIHLACARYTVVRADLPACPTSRWL
jgi:hypothetical protein